MGTFEGFFRMKKRLFGLFCFFKFFFLMASFAEASPSSPQVGRFLFLIQQGEHEQALKLYQNTYQGPMGSMILKCLHQMATEDFGYGFHQHDPECQLLALFGASVSAHEDAYYILEESLKSR